MFKALPIDSSNIVFAGNSITEAFPLNEMFNTLKIKNRGVGGNKSADLLARLDEIIIYKPRKLFLEIGINDIKGNIGIDTLLTNVQNIVNTIKSKTPSTQIYIQSVLPVCYTYEEFNKNILFFNMQMEKLSKTQGFVFINLHPFFKKLNSLDTSLTYDGLHLNGKGYLLLKKILTPYIIQ